MSITSEVLPEFALSSACARIFKIGKKELFAVQEGRLEHKQMNLYSQAEIAGLAYHLLCVLEQEIQTGPSPCAKQHLEIVRDSLSALAEFPSVAN